MLSAESDALDQRPPSPPPSIISVPSAKPSMSQALPPQSMAPTALTPSRIVSAILDDPLAIEAPIDAAYKQLFESTVNAYNNLDKNSSISHDLSLLKFDEIKLNSQLIATLHFAANYVNRAISEDISTRVNKISDTNKNKELVPLDSSKPLHHNTTRGREYKWGPSREVSRTESRTRKRKAPGSNESPSRDYALRDALSPVRGSESPPVENGTKMAHDSSPVPKRKRRPTAAAVAAAAAAANNAAEDGSDSETDGDHKKLKVKLNMKKDNSARNGSEAAIPASTALEPSAKEMKAVIKQYDNTYVAIWKDLSRKDGPKVSRLMQQSTQAKLINLKKTSILAAREAKRWQVKNNKNQKDLTTKARRAMREMFNFWKRNERIERELRKKHEKELVDKAKREEEDREAKRQSRKLNFLITQTELYSHFIGKKIKTDELEGADSDPTLKSHGNSTYDKYADLDHTQHEATDDVPDFDNDDDDALHKAAALNAQRALAATQDKAKRFGEDPLKNPDTEGEEMNFQNPTLMGDLNIEQPDLLKCTLKEYQIKGLNWLANLYEQGINGILADEMGLGKTVQSISVLLYLAETHNIWGPFLVVTPASTLHNWQQEITRFVPDFKVLPYWGTAKDRKVLRKFWDRKNVRYTRDSPFHVMVTSYQLVVADAAYFQKMKWQYMILDEAQAIKSSQSSRWKSLLSFSCRNRLLLTGTPIQNSMQELWALLHFIMPSLFDSHDEFSDWFSKDIESHAQLNTNLDEQQLRRLHVILKPFMLRRIKKNVQSELGDKKEIDVFCDLTNRQKRYYQMLKSQISIMDLLDTSSSANGNGEESTSLINLVMQFRKVCNHPDLFERADVRLSLLCGRFAETSSFLRETNDLEMAYSTENLIDYNLPRLVYNELLRPSFDNNVGFSNKISHMFDIYRPENTVKDSSEFGWLRFVDCSPQEIHHIHHQSLWQRAIDRKQLTDINHGGVNRLKYIYGDEKVDHIPKRKMLLINDYENDFNVVSNSEHLKELYSVRSNVFHDMSINSLAPAYEPKAVAPAVNAVCSTRAFAHQWNDALFDRGIRRALMPLSLNTELSLVQNRVPVPLWPKSDMLPAALNNGIDYLGIRMPSMNRFITDLGKLAKLDELLVDLKQNDHRVLLYFQMTKMMDLMEEYLTYRQYTHIRLDGSSKLDDRRDLVHDWQSKPEIFIFLLSTRAGGLGINLTAADTVIFYDSDWNPTIDSQAMDRAHRLGQTRQVTVYRMLTRGTIEERMRDRAKQKEQVQQVVMEGRAAAFNTKKDDAAKKKKDVAFLLLGEEASENNSDTTPTPLP